jgi:hypothetical protein
VAEGGHKVLAIMLKELFPSEGELISDLDRISAGDERSVNVRVELWADWFNERSDDPVRMPGLLDQWLHERAA